MNTKGRPFISRPELEGSALMLLDKMKLVVYAPISLLKKKTQGVIQLSRTTFTIDYNDTVIIDANRKLVLENNTNMKNFSTKFAAWLTKSRAKLSKEQLLKKAVKYGYDVASLK